MKRLLCWLIGHRLNRVFSGTLLLDDGRVNYWSIHTCDRCEAIMETHRIEKIGDRFAAGYHEEKKERNP